MAENFTVEQILLYCEEIERQKSLEYRLEAFITLYACATAFGGMKFNDFQGFIKTLSGEKLDVETQFEKAKSAGLPIEEN